MIVWVLLRFRTRRAKLIALASFLAADWLLGPYLLWLEVRYLSPYMP